MIRTLLKEVKVKAERSGDRYRRGLINARLEIDK